MLKTAFFYPLIADNFCANLSFRPETLACRAGQNTSTCLNADQIRAVHEVYSPYYGENHTLISPGYYPGGEIGYTTGFVAADIPGQADFYRYFVLKFVS